MKKTIISIIGIALMLLAITACKPNYVVVPPIFDKPSGEVQTGTPVETIDELKEVLASDGEARLEDDMQVSAADLAALEAGTINGDGNKIIVTDTTTASGTKSGLYLKGVSVKDAIIDVSPATRASVTYDDTTYAVMIQGEGTTLENVEIITGGKAGINVHSASNVVLKNVTIDDCAKAPVSISSSTVIIDGITANGSSWYSDNVIQVNGLDGYPAHTASTITFKSTGNIDRVWVEAVATDYNAARDITDSDFEKAGEQTVIEGLDWEVRYSDQASKDVKGWTYYKSATEAETFTLNKEDADLADDELVAMIAAVKGSEAKDHAYDVIKLSQDVELAKYLDVNTSVTIKGADHTIKPATSFTKGPNDEFVLISADGVEFQNVVIDGINTTPGTEAGGWDGEYAIRVYAPDTKNQIKATFENVTIKDADVGMLVRGGNVTLKGNINFENLDWGGIGVDSIGSNDSLTYESKVDASDCTISYTNDGSTTVAKPAIWKERSNVYEVVNTSLEEKIKEASSTGEPDHQTWYVTDNFDDGTTGSGSEESGQ